MEGDAPESKRSKLDPKCESSNPNDALVEPPPSKDVKRMIAKRNDSKELEPSSSASSSSSPKKADETAVKVADDVVDKKDATEKVPEVEQPPSTTKMLDMNAHCVLEIMRCMSLRELCSMAEVNVQLKEVAQQVFAVNHRNVALTSLADPINGKYTLPKVRQLLYNFGNMIKSLTINESGLDDREQYGKLLTLVRKYCYETVDEVVFLDQPSDHMGSLIFTMIFGQEMFYRDVGLVQRRYRTRSQITFQPRKTIQEQFLLYDD